MDPGDCRSRRILVVGDLDDPRLAALSGPGGHGLIQTPPAGMEAGPALAALVLVADQIEDFLRHGYAVRLLAPLPWAEALAHLLAARGIAPLEEISA